MKLSKIAQALGKKGGEARARNLTPEERSRSAKQAAQARWGDRRVGNRKAPRPSRRKREREAQSE